MYVVFFVMTMDGAEFFDWNGNGALDYLCIEFSFDNNLVVAFIDGPAIAVPQLLVPDIDNEGFDALDTGNDHLLTFNKSGFSYYSRNSATVTNTGIIDVYGAVGQFDNNPDDFEWLGVGDAARVYKFTGDLTGSVISPYESLEVQEIRDVTGDGIDDLLLKMPVPVGRSRFFALISTSSGYKQIDFPIGYDITVEQARFIKYENNNTFQIVSHEIDNLSGAASIKLYEYAE